MARKHNSYRRRRKGRFSFLGRIFCFFLILGAFVAAVTLLFRIENITVSGNVRYTQEEVLEASELQTQRNLFLLNKFDAAQRIFQKLPYVDSATIRRRLPDTLEITVQECRPVAAVSAADGVWLVGPSGKLLELCADAPSGCPQVSGLFVQTEQVSAMLSFGEENAGRCESLMAFLTAAEERQMLGEIASVDLADGTCLQFSYAGRFTVKVPWNADYDYKLRHLLSVQDYLEENEAGTINLLADGKASFVPEN